MGRKPSRQRLVQGLMRRRMAAGQMRSARTCTPTLRTFGQSGNQGRVLCQPQIIIAMEHASRLLRGVAHACESIELLRAAFCRLCLPMGEGGIGGIGSGLRLRHRRKL